MPISMHKVADFRRAPLFTLRAGVLALLTAVTLGVSVSARADLFGDDQARQAILDLRRRVDQIVLSQTSWSMTMPSCGAAYSICSNKSTASRMIWRASVVAMSNSRSKCPI
ncbi:MAG: hypothetical protein LBU72_06090 [Burkholderiaceae bacterium]|jgi:hypothetical protein|nr:hypothetical protein [Burkholderiaceae bacterium]